MSKEKVKENIPQSRKPSRGEVLIEERGLKPAQNPPPTPPTTPPKSEKDN